MSQITSGFRALLSHQVVYDALQNVMGAKGIRTELVSEFVRPQANDNILDIGCGTGIMLQYLPASIGYWGYDISKEYIDAAKKRYSGAVNFKCGVLTRGMLAELPKFDVVLAIGVLHHLEDEEARELFSLAYEALKEGGRLVTLDPCFANGQNPIARYLIGKDRGQNVREAEGYRALAAYSFSKIHGVLRHRAWIPYTHWIMECTR